MNEPSQSSLRDPIAILVVAILVAASPTTSHAVGFQWESIESAPANRWTTIRVDARGAPHIGYEDDSAATTRVGYATSETGGWDIETVEATSNIGYNEGSLDLDQEGRPRMAYGRLETGGRRLFYASGAGSWPKDEIKFSQCAFFAVDIAVDDDDTPHVLYHDGCWFEELALEKRNGNGTWTQLITIDVSGTQAALDLGGGSSPRVVFDGNSGVQYTYPDPDGGPNWFVELISTAGSGAMDLVTNGPSLAHVVFYEVVQKDLIYAERTGSWTVTTLDATGDVGADNAIALDSQGEPHIAYYDATNATLRYTTRAGGNWSTQTLSVPGSDVGQNCSIALDPFDQPHITCYDATADEVLYVAIRDCDGDGTSDADEIQSGTEDDCNGNGVPDACEVAAGGGADCDNDGVLDVCEEDCNDNDVPDDCESLNDCNLNDIPDVCEGNDCNGNGRPDDCDLDSGFFLDCNDNGVLDVCEPPFPSDPYFFETTLATPVIDVRASSHAWGDADEDGDLDIVVSGIANFGIGTITRVYHRGPSGFHNIEALGLWPLEDSISDWNDFDNDGDLDLFQGGSLGSLDVFHVYHDTGITCTPSNGNCYLIFDAFPNVDGLRDAVWIDYDGDADRDVLFVGFSDPTRFFRNDGVEFVDVGLEGLTSDPLSSAAVGDVDADGDDDLLVTGSSGLFSYYAEIYRNDGGTFAPMGAGLPEISGTGEWADYDADGDLDIILIGGTGLTTSDTAILRNDDGTFVDTGTTLDPLSGAELNWGDYDNDGDLDVLYWGNEIGGTNRFSGIFRNEGGVFEALDMGFESLKDAAISWADQDGDGDLDVLISGDKNVGTNPSLSVLYDSECGTQNTPPLPPTNLQLAIDGTSHTFSWDPGSDAETPSDGLTYNLRVGTAPGASDILSAMSDETTGYRRVPKMGNTTHTRSWTLDIPGPGPVFWGVQSIDGSYAGSVFATDATQPVCSISPRSIDFGHVAGHADSSFTITNTGGSQLTGDVTSTCSDFIVLSGGGPFSLGANESLQVDVRFTPLSLGSHACSIDLGIEACTTRAYLGDLAGGMKILDVTDPTSPQLVSSTPHFTLEMQIVDGFAYTTGETDVFRIGGVFDAANPYDISSTAVTSYTRDVRIVGTTAYVATSSSGQMHILDIETPTNPVLLGTFNSADHVWRLDVEGDYAYLASETEGLQVVEADDLVDPDRDGQYLTPAPAWGVDVVGNIAYVASSDAGLQILDITTPSPAFMSSVAIPGRCDDVQVEADYAYVAAGDSGLAVVDVSDPLLPVLVGRHQTGDWASSVDVFAGLAYIAARSSGLEIVDVQDPANPTLIGSYDTDGESRGIHVVGGVEVVGTGDAVIGVPVVPAPDLALRLGRPNPFTTSMTVQLSLDRETDVRVTIYDVAGRRVRTLVDARLDAGNHVARWDGRDEAGYEVPSGTYFMQLRDASRVLTRRIVRLR